MKISSKFLGILLIGLLMQATPHAFSKQNIPLNKTAQIVADSKGIRGIKTHSGASAMQAKIAGMQDSAEKAKLTKQLVLQEVKLFQNDAKNLLKTGHKHTSAAQIKEIDKITKTITDFANFNEQIIGVRKYVNLRTQIAALKAQKIQALYDQSAKAGEILYTARDVKQMFPKGKLPENVYTKTIWGEPIKDENGRRVQSFDRKIDETTAQIAALYMRALGKDVNYLETPSSIEEMSKKALLVSFAKYTNMKGTADYYIDLAETSPKDFENIMESMLNQPKAVSFEYAVFFKDNSWPINSGISSFNLNFIRMLFTRNLPYRWGYINYFQRMPGTLAAVNGLTDFISHSYLKNKTKLYRGGQLDGVLNLLKDKQGRDLRAGTAIENFIKSNPDATEDVIEEFVDSLLVGQQIEQDRFLSTTMNRDLAVEWASSNRINGGQRNPFKVVWKIHAEQGEKGAFLEPFNRMTNNYYDQYEFLLQRSSLLKYVDCRFEKETGILEIEVQLVPSNEPQRAQIIEYSEEIDLLERNYIKIMQKKTNDEISQADFEAEESKINQAVLDTLDAGLYRVIPQ